MNATAPGSAEFIECWNSVLTPKWIRFRHLLSDNGKIHSDLAAPYFGIRAGDKVLDIGCGFGETCLELGHTVGEAGEVLGLDCTGAFLEVANRERDAAGLANVRYELGDAQVHPLAKNHYDIAYSRFGIMFFENAVTALRNVATGLKRDGRLCLVVWRRLVENPAWLAAKSAVLEVLAAPDPAQTCGPGPFSWGDETTSRQMLAAAGFPRVDAFERIDADICVGRTVEEAIEYQVLVGPSGEIIRKAGDEGKGRLPDIRDRLAKLMRAHLRDDGVYLPSSTWAIVARKSGIPELT